MMELGTCFVREDSFKGWSSGGELLDFKDRGQRRKLQLYGDNGERES